MFSHVRSVAAQAPPRAARHDADSIAPVHTPLQTAAHGSAPEPAHLSIPVLAGGAFMAAVAGQALLSPTAWARTPSGFVRRVGDQVGFVIAEESLREATVKLTGWHPDERPCATDWLRLAPCASVRVFGARTADSRRRVNLPLVVGILGGTLTSLAWRPERTTNAEARNFVVTRLAISAGVPVLIRMVTELRRRE